ncbi:hypothetical protein [Azospirillum sp. INR13]|uniref:hypothetical protein n=1 Tax=Azospirillum sp. INR13 TaxID=2596919 RepID=UPI00351CAE47
MVATEVKNLAGQTQGDGGDLRPGAEMQTATSSAVAAIRTISDAVTAISGTVTDMPTRWNSRASATREIAQNVQQAAEGTQQVMRNIAEVTSATKTGGARMPSECSRTLTARRPTARRGTGIPRQGADGVGCGRRNVFRTPSSAAAAQAAQATTIVGWVRGIGTSCRRPAAW